MRNLLRGLYRRIADAPIAAHHAAAFGQTVLGVDLVEMLLRHELDADPRRALFSSLSKKNHIAVERHARALQQEHRHQRCGDVVFVVDGAAAIDVAAVARRAERRERPFRGVDVHGVGVPHQEQRSLLAVPFQPGDDIQPVRLELEDLRGDALAFEDLLEVLGCRPLVPRRIARIEPEHRLKVLHAFGLDARPVDGRCLSDQSCGAGHEREKQQKKQRAAMIDVHRRPSYHGLFAFRSSFFAYQLPPTSYFSGFGVAFASTSPRMYCMPARKCPTISGFMKVSFMWPIEL